MAKRGVHDMGGDSAGTVDTHEHAPTMTERRIDALMLLLRNKPRPFWTTDENRRTIESLTPKAYRDSGYYQRWAYAMRGLLIEKGVLSEAEVNDRLKVVKAHFKAAKATKSASRKPTKRSASPPKSKASPSRQSRSKRSRSP